jgi:hypothetical protein
MQVLHLKYQPGWQCKGSLYAARATENMYIHVTPRLIAMLATESGYTNRLAALPLHVIAGCRCLVSQDQHSAVFAAVQQGKPDMVQYLVQHGATLEARDHRCVSTHCRTAVSLPIILGECMHTPRRSMCRQSTG